MRQVCARRQSSIATPEPQLICNPWVSGPARIRLLVLGLGHSLDPASTAAGWLILKGRVDHALDLGQIVRGSVVGEIMLFHRSKIRFGLSVANDMAKLLGNFVQLSQLTTEWALLWCFDEAFLSRTASVLASSRWRREHTLYGTLPVKGLVGLLGVRWLALWDRRRLERWPGRVSRRLAGRSGVCVDRRLEVAAQVVWLGFGTHGRLVDGRSVGNGIV